MLMGCHRLRCELECAFYCQVLARLAWYRRRLTRLLVLRPHGQPRSVQVCDVYCGVPYLHFGPIEKAIMLLHLSVREKAWRASQVFMHNRCITH